MPILVRSEIPAGDGGTFATLDAMEALVRDALTVPLTHHTTDRILAGSGLHDAAARLRDWLARWYVFAHDPLEMELVVSPPLQLCKLTQNGYLIGDCDDVAVLAAALGASAGLLPRFVVIALEPGGPYEHVWTELSPNGFTWTELDVVADKQGLAPAQAGARRAVRVLNL